MQLKNQVEWALHCCTILAAVPAGHYMPGKSLAELHGVPKEYLAKALQALSQANLVEGTLGPNGGYRLARKPSEITFLDIVEAVEGNASTFACTEIRANNPTLPKGHCNRNVCGIAHVMWEADAAWRNHLRGVRLSDVARMLKKNVEPKILANTLTWIKEHS